MKREKLSIQWVVQKQHIFEKQAEIVSNKSSELNEEEMAAVLNANFGDMAYDKKHTGLNGPSPNVANVLTVLSGEEYLKTHLNGAMKSARKSDRIKSERTPNPYAKHYLNGLAVRSQRYFNKPKKASSLQPSSLDVKTNLSFSSQNSTDHLTSDDGCDSSKDFHDINLNTKFISQSDSKFECFSANDNAIVNLESYHINDVSVKPEDCNSEECKTGTEICFTDIPTFSQSSNDSTFDPSVTISTLSLDELVSDIAFKNEIVSTDCVSNTYQSKSCNGLENDTQDFSNIKKELSPMKEILQNKILMSPKECVDDKLSSIILNSEEISNLSNPEQIIASTEFEDIKLNLELPVENCIDVVTIDTIPSVEIAENSREKIISDVKTKVEKIIDFHNDDKLNSPVSCVIIKSEIPIIHSKIESTSKKVKSIKLSESCDKLVKIENSESTDCLESSKINVDKSPTNPVTTVKDKDIKIRPSSNKSSPLRTQSPTYKSTENGIIKGSKSNSKQNFKKLQALAKSKSKSLTNSHSASSLVNKSHSSSVNKCQEKNSSAVCETDVSETKESDKTSAAAPVPRKDMLRGYKIPKKTRTEKPEENSLDLKRGNTPLSPLPDITSTSFSGYQTKGPSWRKLEPRTKDVPSCKPRTNINMNGNIQPQSSERLVLKLKKDTSDPESQRWKADHNNFNRSMNTWMGNHHPPPPPHLLHPHPHPRFITHHVPRPWQRMRSRGGFRQIHMGYGNGPYT